MSIVANQLADRIQEGASTLANFARELNDAQWKVVVPRDGRTVGVIVHHVANMYPIELGVVQMAVDGKAITDVTWEVVADINAKHAKEMAGVGKAEALDLLARNSLDAARAIRKLTDADLARAVPFSLSFGAPMTVQFIIEDHPLRHPWQHLARIKAALRAIDTTSAAA